MQPDVLLSLMLASVDQQFASSVSGNRDHCFELSGWMDCYRLGCLWWTVIEGPREKQKQSVGLGSGARVHNVWREASGV